MSDPSSRPAYHPQNAGQWLMLALLWLMAKLPPRCAFAMGEQSGRLLPYLSRRRRDIALRNQELCLPELTHAERWALVKANSRYMGRATAETALAFLCIELAARLIGPQIDMAAIYKPLRKKPLMDRAMLRSRRRTLVDALPREDLRGIIRTLKARMPAWYAGDQDYGTRKSVFAPFMGVPAAAATVTGLTRLTRLSHARVVPLFFNVNRAGDGYEITLAPALEGFPAGSDHLDAQWINSGIGRSIHAQPEQYLRVHRRFKHPPPGERPAYRNSLQKSYNRVEGAPW